MIDEGVLLKRIDEVLRENRELKEMVARLNRMIESIQPFICKSAECEMRR